MCNNSPVGSEALWAVCTSSENSRGGIILPVLSKEHRNLPITTVNRAASWRHHSTAKLQDAHVPNTILHSGTSASWATQLFDVHFLPPSLNEDVHLTPASALPFSQLLFQGAAGRISTFLFFLPQAVSLWMYLWLCSSSDHTLFCKAPSSLGTSE